MKQEFLNAYLMIIKNKKQELRLGSSLEIDVFLFVNTCTVEEYLFSNQMLSSDFKTKVFSYFKRKMLQA